MFELIIDGCNGPIRFRQQNLTALETKGGSHDENGAETASSRRNIDGNGDDDETILSFLRPESIKSMRPKDKLYSSSSRSKKKKKKNGQRNKNKPKITSSAESDNFEESFDRLNMIPLLEKLLESSSPILDEKEMEQNEQECVFFHSISVIFDGVSITKRSSFSGLKNKNKENPIDVVEREAEERIVQGQFWRVATKNTTTDTVEVLASGTGLSNSVVDGDGYLTIEVTGLYDETDNVIVERIQEYHRRNNSNSVQQSRGPVQGSDDANHIAKTQSFTRSLTRIQTLRRTERGAGKNRRLFQRLGLLRPESVACVFDFGAVDIVSKTTAEMDGDTTGSSSTRFRKLALDGDQTLRTASTQRLHPSLLTLEEPIEISHSDTETVPVVPIVVTDDVFLRQRIVQEGGYVMTFHQLWLLLTDVLLSNRE